MPGVNFLLLDRTELAADGEVTLRDRRATHLRQVLAVEVGQTLRAGIIDGPRAAAVVLAIAGETVTVRVTTTQPTPPPRDVLLLAVPRPKVLLRLYAAAAALGFGQLVLFRCWRVEKSHLQSKALDPTVQREHLLHGLEQAGRTHLPRITFAPLFKPMVEDLLPTLGLPPQRFVAHPTAAVRTHELAPLGAGPFALAIGPDGGFLPYEVDRLVDQGLLPITCGPEPQRTEVAVALLAGQLALLRERATVPR